MKSAECVEMEEAGVSVPVVLDRIAVQRRIKLADHDHGLSVWRKREVARSHTRRYFGRGDIGEGAGFSIEPVTDHLSMPRSVT